ncbi:hypothetical protein BGZ99_002135 [Dissophora globulifera]|uniref:Ras-GEF domain-containing protein n=1 Tax=Dissophora globulifera TaxID=979702 RepID=A0A9P6RN38_9FUNG|nr:hypothetical protein BGZ99_002135 [Dissophora globulifera]
MRVKVVEKFIRVAHTCYNHSNFSSLIQVMLGLQVHPVSRLSQTWARVRAQEMRIMHDLVEFTSPFHNWKHIRDAMKNIADEWGGGVGNSGSTASTPPNSGKSASTATAGGSGGVAFFGKRTSKPKVATMTAKKTAATPGNSRRPSMVQPPMEMSATTTMSTQPSSYFSSHPFHHKGTLSTVAPTSPYSSVHNKDRDKERHPHDKEAAKPVQQGGCIPFLGLYLADLVFNTELPSYVEPSTFTPDSRPLVNIHKHRTTATIIKRVLTFRTLCGRYPFQPEPEVRDMLLAIQSLDSSELLQKSHVCEERATDAGQ